MHTVHKIELNNFLFSEKPKNLPMDVVLFFPYFNEPQVTEHMPYMKMSDYKVVKELYIIYVCFIF